MKKNYIKKITLSGVLIAIGLVIPMFSPFKIVIEPASFTLASHVAIFTAMFISPSYAISVAIGTTIGFFLGGFPIIIVLRAFTHVVFATMGAFYLNKRSKKSLSVIKLRVFSFSIALIHALGEVIVVSAFYFGNNINNNYLVAVILLVGLGTLVHSMVDFEIANIIVLPFKKQKDFQILFDRK